MSLNPPGSGTPAPPDTQGSLGTGVGLFFACILGGGAACTLLGGMLSGLRLPSALLVPVYLALGLAPWAAAIAVGVRAAAAGRRRTAIGVLLGFGILVGIVLLLVAACFGLVASSGLNPH